MSRETRGVRRWIGVGVAVVAWAAGAVAEEIEWDGERVAELVGELDRTVQDLLDDPGLESKQQTAMQQRRHHSAIVGVREFGRLASDLARRLRQGRSYEQTRAIWDQMMMVVEEIRYYASASWLPPQTRAKANRANELIDSIEPYYAGD